MQFVIKEIRMKKLLFLFLLIPVLAFAEGGRQKLLLNDNGDVVIGTTTSTGETRIIHNGTVVLTTEAGGVDLGASATVDDLVVTGNLYVNANNAPIKIRDEAGNYHDTLSVDTDGSTILESATDEKIRITSGGGADADIVISIDAAATDSDIILDSGSGAGSTGLFVRKGNTDLATFTILGILLDPDDSMIYRDEDADRLLLVGGTAANPANGAIIDIRGDDFGGADAGGGIFLSSGDNSSGSDIQLNARDEVIIQNASSTVAIFDSGGMNITGEINVSGAGTSQGVVCVKADGDFGQCSSAVGAGGTCTCG